MYTHTIQYCSVHYTPTETVYTQLQALITKQDRDGQYYKEAMLLQAKTNYIQGKFQECLDVLEKVGTD